MRRRWTTGLPGILLVSTGLLAAACTTTGRSGAEGAGARDTAGQTAVDDQPEGSVLVFAAASLSEAFTAIADEVEAANPGIDVELSVGGSSGLREQILDGAPADVFASANESTMAAVVEAGEVAGEPEVFVTNALQIAVPAGNPGGVVGLDDFADPALVNGVCTEGVPCGDFARQVLANADLEASIDTFEPDVGALLAKIEADELDAGIVYLTDVIRSGSRVEGIEIPDEVNVRATYPIATLRASPNPDGGRAFVAFVLSPEGQAILARHGFALP